MEFYSSDQHWFHTNIITLSKRPFGSIEEMNETLINNHNSVVSKNDLVYHVGDICMGTRTDSLKVISKLNGTHILISGNHDYCFNKSEDNKWYKLYLDSGISEIHQVLVLEGERYKEIGGSIRLHHFPVKEAFLHPKDKYEKYRLSSDGILHLSGHTHDKNHIAGYKNIHIGVDATKWNYSPVSLDQIISLYLEQGW